ncbi:CLUMA_CG003298, isoform A [Clunio marinus]|uniref:CLUMA_CG003298, isoform A n=1 Tax=Clunio marinus TaxID=568069 RepID=A0A1J1HNP5_9DIPT|nr:CLUMA_CG003298, isoform A [Clunio marinus]
MKDCSLKGNEEKNFASKVEEYLAKDKFLWNFRPNLTLINYTQKPLIWIQTTFSDSRKAATRIKE